LRFAGVRLPLVGASVEKKKMAYGDPGYDGPERLTSSVDNSAVERNKPPL
jgi:hypothetical protein